MLFFSHAVDPSRNCSVDNVCEQQCVRSIGSSNMSVEVCSCMSGFTLDTNMRNCTGKYKTLLLMITSCKRVFILYLQMLMNAAVATLTHVLRTVLTLLADLCVVVPVVID